MKTAQAMVLEFHKALNIPIGETPRVREAELRTRLLLEETKETVEALERGDLVEVIDGLCDVIYVALGTAVSCGVDLEPFFAEVHRSNMSKVGGEVRADGKVLKPSTWTPPDIKGLLDQRCHGSPATSCRRRGRRREDNAHCGHWWDGEKCCACGAGK